MATPRTAASAAATVTASPDRAAAAVAAAAVLEREVVGDLKVRIPGLRLGANQVVEEKEDLNDGKANTFLFEPWAKRMREILVDEAPALGLSQLHLPKGIVSRRGGRNGEAEVRGEVFGAREGGRSDEASLSSTASARRFRTTLMRNGRQMQAFNAALYPSYSLGPLPVLGVDVLSFNNHQRLMFSVDWSPMLPDAAYAEEHVSPFVADVRERHSRLFSKPSAKFYGEHPEFFSSEMCLSRPYSLEALEVGGELWNVFEEYCIRYRDLLLRLVADRSAGGGGVVPPASAAMAQERQAAYDAWHAQRDPALPIFRTLFGQQWTEEYVNEVLFPGSSVLVAS